MVRRMIWPWARKAEDRASDAFGAAAVAALVAQASGGVTAAQAASTAAVEAAAGLLGRAFGAAGGIRNRRIRVRYESGRLGVPETLIDNI